MTGGRGALGALALIAVLVVAVLAPQLSFASRTRAYAAEFANAAGLAAGDPVTVAGVPAGRVTDVALADDRVRVEFRLDRGQPLGDRTTAAIELRTVLGARYVDVTPAGRDRLETIPLERTTVPYRLDRLQADAAGTTEELDLAAVRRMIGTLTEVAPEDPALLGDALTGIAEATRALDEREGRIRDLLSGTRSLTGSLVEQQDVLVRLLGDARSLAEVLEQRRAVIRSLIADVARVTDVLAGLLHTDRAEIDALLAELDVLTDSLARIDGSLAEVVRRLGPTSRYIANATGNGPWGDVSAPAGPIPDNLLCVAGLLEGCR
ncbi:MCE family protein [Saccharopolyspora cebuensis]|uniref:MCE family protein n=1 Tax=Saccharopolyspora cebuensis TaxID=418759 RepID=A0ABV4CJX0_9PSEU